MPNHAASSASTARPDVRRQRTANRPSAAPRAGWWLATLLCVVVLTGCDQPTTSGSTEDAPGNAASASDGAPPGFLDPAPPPPDSDTQIFSGGTLIGAAVADAHPTGLFDAVVVVRNGTLIGYGRRGSVDVPADSVGIDTSGQFIEPVGVFAPGQPVAFNVYGQRPGTGAEQPPLTGRFADGRWQTSADGEG